MIEEKQLQVIVGFSVNLETVAGTNNSEEEKSTLRYLYRFPGGSSINISNALKSTGSNSKVLGLVNESSSDWQELERFLKGYDFIPLDYLNGINCALVTTHNNQVRGMKYNLKEGTAGQLSEEVKEHLKPGGVRICSGIRKEEVPLACEMFEKEGKEKNFLNVKEEVLFDKDLLDKLLSRTGYLFLNQQEYFNAQLKAEDYHQKGVQVLIITNGAYGGRYSIKGEDELRGFDSHRFDGEDTLTTGAGDWLMGSFTGFLINENPTLSNVSHQQTKNALDKASKVAGKKITYPGAANGPTAEEVKNLLS